MKEDKSPNLFPLSRRHFLKALGGGIIICFSSDDLIAQGSQIVGLPGFTR